MNDKVKGFVLTQSDYKESDILLQVLTLEYGMLSLVAKAGKKMDGKNHILPMCVYEFIIDYKPNKTIYSIHGNKLIDSYFEIDNFEMMSFKNILIEVTIKNKDINCFNQLCFVFKNINDNNKYLLGSMYFSFLSKQFGIMPNVDECTVCGSKKIVSLSNTNGGFVCEKHLNGINTISVDRLRKFRLIVKGEFKDYDVLKEFDYDINDFNLICNFFLENAYINLKAYDFYRKIS